MSNTVKIVSMLITGAISFLFVFASVMYSVNNGHEMSVALWTGVPAALVQMALFFIVLRLTKYAPNHADLAIAQTFLILPLGLIIAAVIVSITGFMGVGLLFAAPLKMSALLPLPVLLYIWIRIKTIKEQEIKIKHL